MKNETERLEKLELPSRKRVISKVFNEMAIGKDEHRCDGFDPLNVPENCEAKKYFANSKIEKIAITSDTEVLIGYVYRPRSTQPDAKSPKTQTVVIFFSGSEGSNAAMIGQAVQTYNNLGAIVVGVDYRGFGESNATDISQKLNSKNITETSLYEDGMKIFEWVRTTFKVPASSVILHGFSLGGAVAARIAAELSYEAISKNQTVASANSSTTHTSTADTSTISTSIAGVSAASDSTRNITAINAVTTNSSTSNSVTADTSSDSTSKSSVPAASTSISQATTTNTVTASAPSDSTAKASAPGENTSTINPSVTNGGTGREQTIYRSTDSNSAFQIPVGGLVLHSSIRNMSEAASGTLPLPKPLANLFGFLGGLLTGGSYDVALCLKELAKLNPSLKVHFRGGSEADELSLEKTRLDQFASFFPNSPVFVGSEPHQIFSPPAKTAANLTSGIPFL
jgi:dienelactone hydrolase